ncbi:MAG: class I SAM-dependent methyltransferase [Anaerolineales bacterium]|nr:class I SAM-dependent methyltransferase [Anaerolineales bacterium]
MTDTDIYIQRLLEANPLREPLLRSVIQALQLPPGSRGLDVGCGIGLQELLLADAVGCDGHVTGVDVVPEFLAFGEKLAGQFCLSERISFRLGDMNRLPFDEDTFDWAWSADCIGYPAGELVPQLKELMRVVKPGGTVVILAWSSQQVLPGYPLLEARLNATCSAYLPFLKGKGPELHFLRALQWFREAGFEEFKAQTFVGDVQAPLSSDERTALTSLFEMLWVEPQPDLLSEAWMEYQRLCKPESADFILDQPGYYGFFTYSMFRSKVPRK